MALLEAREIVKQYHNRRVVDGVSLQVENGSVVGLLGPNGAGKTTSFYMIAGFVRPKTGRVLLDEEDITGLPIHRRAKRGISYLAQEPSVFKKLTVEENIRIVLEPLGLKDDEIDNRINNLLEDMNGRRIAVLGDMLELGNQAPALHSKIGAIAARTGISRLYARGEFADLLVAGARDEGMQPKDTFEGTHDEIVEDLKNWLQPGDWFGSMLVRPAETRSVSLTIDQQVP